MKVAVIGAGASGLVAAYAAAANGNEVTVFEKNEKCGKKIYITGKGRCNVTNNVPPVDFLSNVVTNSKFLSSAIYSFPPERLMSLIESGGTKLKTERGNRVFPVSDKASDITRALESLCKKAGVTFNFNTEIKDLGIFNSTISDINTGKERIKFDKVIVCTGGMTYPATGSTGDGYKFAKQAGHSLISTVPSLCGVNLVGNYFISMQGLTLKNVSLGVYVKGKLIKKFFGEMLFTHFGASGPIVLSASALINRENLNDVLLKVDLKSALDEKTLDDRILRDFADNSNKSVSNCLKALLPNAVIDEILKRSNISPEKKVNAVTKSERSSLLTNIKNFDMLVSSLRGFDEAIVTSGGIDVKQIDPKTMESKLVKGLYFCGEVLDVDAFTGGFNLQIAFSSGFAAGNSIK